MLSRIFLRLICFVLCAAGAFGVTTSCGEPDWTRDLLRNTRSIRIVVVTDEGVTPTLDLIEINVKLLGGGSVIFSAKGVGEDETEISKKTTVDKLENGLRGICGDDWVNRNLTQVPGANQAVRTPSAAAGASASGQASQGFAMEDLNGDGNLDRLSLQGNNLEVILQAADGTALSKRTFPAGFAVNEDSRIVVADFNGDGKLDVAINDSGDGGADTGGIFVMAGNGDGTFGTAKRIAAGTSPVFPVAADFNNDGKTDLAAVNFNTGTISVLTGAGNGTFAAPVSYAAGANVILGSLIAPDVNGDGLPDLVMSAGNSATVSVLLNSGGRFGAPIVTTTPGGAMYLAYCDFNHDGKMDVVAAGMSTNAITMLMGNGDGTFQTPAAYAVGNKPSSIGVIPLNDGNTLLLTADDTTRGLLITPVSPQGEVYAPPYHTVGGKPTAVAAGDLNGDGQADAVITGGTSAVSVMLAQGGSHFLPPVGYSLGQDSASPTAVAMADLNGDQKLDVIVANAPGSGTPSVVVMLGNGDGTLKTGTATTVGQNPQSLAVGDFNGDNKPDVAVAAYGTSPFGPAGSDPGGVFILLGKGDGTFQAPTSVSVAGLHPLAVGAADLNGDGKLDLAVAMGADTSHPATLAVFLGQGNGTFAQARTTPLRTTAGVDGGVTIGDFNGDGKPDVAVVSGFGQLVDVLLGDGAGGFREMEAIPSTEFGPGALVAADVNKDGKLDLVIPHCCGDTDGTYLLGNGDGSFQKEQHFVSGYSPTALTATKFGGSRGPDLLVTQEGGTWLALVNDFVVSTAPSATSTGPGFGSGSSGTFTFTFSSPGGFGNLQVVDVLINSVLDGRRACYIAFVPASAGSGSIYLVDDAGDAGGPYAGMALPGSGSVSNGQCSISGAGSSVNGIGDTLTLTLGITFSASFGGNKVFYLSAQDKAALNSGWQTLGTWSVPGAAAAGPGVGGVTPGHGSSATQTFTFTFTDTNGWQDITVANVLMNSAIDGRGACYLAFSTSSRSLFLVDDAGDAGGPYQGMQVPGAGTIGNSQCSIAGSSFSGSGNSLTLTLTVTFSPLFAGNRVIYLAARTDTKTSDWQAAGTISVP